MARGILSLKNVLSLRENRVVEEEEWIDTLEIFSQGVGKRKVSGYPWLMRIFVNQNVPSHSIIVDQGLTCDHV